MKPIHEEYFFLWDDGETPSLTVEDKELAILLMWHEHRQLPDKPYDLYIRDTIPRNFTLGDFYFLSGKRQVVSKRIKTAIESLHPTNIDFLPADIHFHNDFEEEYFIINSYNRISCMDLDKSEWRKSHHPDGGVLSIDKLVLDTVKLGKIPIEQRLVFILDECETFTLYHESIVDKIEKLNPSGMHAISVDAWDSDIGFML
ncbi:hypothetical protein FACS1894159_03080 [Bacteroidia bacterium]|nr:hypothetical protein FACS1894159_03080 [Bacteroidia bacterium]